MSRMDFVAAQSDSLEPLGFQQEIIGNLSAALLSHPCPPVLLRAPTGSGKTFMLVRALARVCAAQPTVWLWFVPFVNLVQQTEDAILANAHAQLFPIMLSHGRNQEPQKGMVLLSTAAGVASAKDRKQGYAGGADDEQRALNEFVALARQVQGLKIGVVVDEAHIGLKDNTEFGKFVSWVQPDYLVMASATPRDDALDRFLVQAGKEARTSFVVTRAQAVQARLNKKYIEAVTYDLQHTIASLADLKRTVLRQAWRKHLWLKRALKAADIDLMPLLLVQVANGKHTVEEARDDLMALCRVPADAIGMHSAEEPDPVLMAAIANDYSKEVLIFKQSAGTGFDAPRAFVLASTKLVNDADFAMQFIGRVMRVAAPVRRAFAPPTEIPAQLDTAYIYLADGETQRGFQSAVNITGAVKSQLEGQTEQMVVRHTQSGATVITNRISPQLPAFYDNPLASFLAQEDEDDEDEDAARGAQLVGLDGTSGGQSDLFGDKPAFDPGTTIMGADRVREPAPAEDLPANEAQVLERLKDQGVMAYPLNRALLASPPVFQQENHPSIIDMGKVSASIAADLPLTEDTVSLATQAVWNLLYGKETHTELTRDDDTPRVEKVQVITDRESLTHDAISKLKEVARLDDADVRIIITTLASRLRENVAIPPDGVVSAEAPDDRQLDRRARDAACWVVRQEIQRIGEMIQQALAEFTTVSDAAPLPDYLLYPLAHALLPARKNLYGVFPPPEGEIAGAWERLDIDLQDRLLKDIRENKAQTLSHAEGVVSVFAIHGKAGLNQLEHDFAQALEHDEHVLWWHRNPDRKQWSVRVVRGEHKDYFYPDFIVCLEYPLGQPPEIRLVETKESTKDASRKAQRAPRIYGKVLFVTPDGSRLRIVNDDGSLGAELDGMNLMPAWRWMAGTR